VSDFKTYTVDDSPNYTHIRTADLHLLSFGLVHLPPGDNPIAVNKYIISYQKHLPHSPQGTECSATVYSKIAIT